MDYGRLYGLNPDEQPVADVVRASMSIPFFFKPSYLTNAATQLKSTLLDGGLLSNFPIDSLDRTDGKKPRWPTFGITIMPNLPAGDDKIVKLPFTLRGPAKLLEAVIATTIVGRDNANLNEPWVKARTIRVDSTDVGVLDFDIDKQQTEDLYNRGYASAQTFLDTWSFEEYKARFRPEPG